jgi:hypothetical protein
VEAVGDLVGTGLHSGHDRSGYGRWAERPHPL